MKKLLLGLTVVGALVAWRGLHRTNNDSKLFFDRFEKLSREDLNKTCRE